MHNLRHLANKYASPDQEWLAEQKIHFTKRALGSSLLVLQTSNVWSRFASLKMSVDLGLMTLKRWHLKPVVSFVAMAAILMLAVFPMVRTATKLVLPTSPLYIAKLAAEKAQTALTFSTNGEAILHLDLAQSRLDELQSLSVDISADSQEQVKKIARQYASEVSTVKNRLQILKGEKNTGASLTITMAKLLLDKGLSYRQTLEAINNPDQSIKDALKETQSAVDIATSVLIDANQKKEGSVSDADVKKAVENKVDQVEGQVKNSAGTDFNKELNVDLNIMKQDVKNGDYASAFSKASLLENKVSVPPAPTTSDVKTQTVEPAPTPATETPPATP